MTAPQYRHTDLVLLGLTVLLFSFWGELDLVLARLFYLPMHGFTLWQTWWVELTYHLVARFWLLAPLLAALLLATTLPRFRARWRGRRRALAYLLAVLLLGPGLIANTALKNHWGRARPVHLSQFGGHASFTPALQPSRQCPRNCAFVSGHAAAAFYLMAGYWVTGRRRWLLGGIGFGLFVGLVRMAMGAHFLSDVLYAGFVVWFTCKLLAPAFFGRRSGTPLAMRAHAHPSAAAE